jgi:hypothetical protein
MNLKDCKLGVIVIEKNENISGTKEIGHIVGLTKNCTGEVIPVVKWASDYTGSNSPNDSSHFIRAIHHANIKEYK